MVRRLVLALAALLVFVPGLRGEIIEQILVKVNGEILTKSDLELRQLRAIRELGNIDPATASEGDVRQAIANVTPLLLVDAVDEMLLLQRGREIGQQMTEEQFRSIVANLRKENPGLETDAQFEAALKQEGMTMTDLRRMFERQVITSRVQQMEVMPKISVTEEEARGYFEQHPDEFRADPGITLREILVRVPEETGGVNVGLDEEARGKAEALRGRALEGEAFDKLAAENSDAPSRANGGLVGPLKREDLAPDFQRLADQLTPGQISEILRSRQGYQFFKLESRTDTDRMTFEQAREGVTNRLGDEKRVAELARYLESLRTQAIIEWRNDELKKAYEQGLAVRAKQLAPAAGL